MNIKVYDIIGSSHAISQEKGKKLLPYLENAVKNKEYLEVDFVDIDSTISTFFNTCYAVLFKSNSLEDIDKYIKFKNVKRITEQQIDTVKNNAINYYRVKSNANDNK